MTQSAETNAPTIPTTVANDPVVITRTARAKDVARQLEDRRRERGHAQAAYEAAIRELTDAKASHIVNPDTAAPSDLKVRHLAAEAKRLADDVSVLELAHQKATASVVAAKRASHEAICAHVRTEARAILAEMRPTVERLLEQNQRLAAVHGRAPDQLTAIDLPKTIGVTDVLLAWLDRTRG